MYKHSPQQKCHILTLPLSTRQLSSKTTPIFCHKWQRVSHWEVIISLSLEELALSSSSPSSSLKASREGDREAMKPPRRACRRAIRLTQVFTWHNLSVRVARRAFMRWSYTMMTSKVTSPDAEEEWAKVEGTVESAGLVDSTCGHFNRSWASLRQTKLASMAPIKVK